MLIYNISMPLFVRDKEIYKMQTAGGIITLQHIANKKLLYNIVVNSIKYDTYNKILDSFCSNFSSGLKARLCDEVKEIGQLPNITDSSSLQNLIKHRDTINTTLAQQLKLLSVFKHMMGDVAFQQIALVAGIDPKILRDGDKMFADAPNIPTIDSTESAISGTLLNIVGLPMLILSGFTNIVRTSVEDVYEATIRRPTPDEAKLTKDILDGKADPKQLSNGNALQNATKQIQRGGQFGGIGGTIKIPIVGNVLVQIIGQPVMALIRGGRDLFSIIASSGVSIVLGALNVAHKTASFLVGSAQYGLKAIVTFGINHPAILVAGTIGILGAAAVASGAAAAFLASMEGASMASVGATLSPYFASLTSGISTASSALSLWNGLTGMIKSYRQTPEQKNINAIVDLIKAIGANIEKTATIAIDIAGNLKKTSNDIHINGSSLRNELKRIPASDIDYLETYMNNIDPKINNVIVSIRQFINGLSETEIANIHDIKTYTSRLEEVIKDANENVEKGDEMYTQIKDNINKTYDSLIVKISDIDKMKGDIDKSALIRTIEQYRGQVVDIQTTADGLVYMHSTTRVDPSGSGIVDDFKRVMNLIEYSFGGIKAQAFMALKKFGEANGILKKAERAINDAKQTKITTASTTDAVGAVAVDAVGALTLSRKRTERDYNNELVVAFTNIINNLKIIVDSTKKILEERKLLGDDIKSFEIKDIPQIKEPYNMEALKVYKDQVIEWGNSMDEFVQSAVNKLTTYDRLAHEDDAPVPRAEQASSDNVRTNKNFNLAVDKINTYVANVIDIYNTIKSYIERHIKEYTRPRIQQDDKNIDKTQITQFNDIDIYNQSITRLDTQIQQKITPYNTEYKKYLDYDKNTVSIQNIIDTASLIGKLGLGIVDDACIATEIYHNVHNIINVVRKLIPKSNAPAAATLVAPAAATNGSSVGMFGGGGMNNKYDYIKQCGGWKGFKNTYAFYTGK